MAVIYDEGRTEKLTREGVEVVRTLRVTPYSERGYVADLFLGGARLIGGFLFRIPPARDPWFPWCICQSVDIQGTGAYTGTAPSNLNNAIVRASYNDGCRMVVTYRTPEAGQSTLDPRDGDLEGPPPPPTQPPNGQGQEAQNAQQEIDLSSENYDYGGTVMTHDGTKVGLSNGLGQTPEQDGLISSRNAFATKYVSHIDYTLTRHYVARAPWTAISRLVGTVNKSAFVRGRITWPKETILFQGLQTSRKITSFGVKLWELVYKFKIRSHYDLVSTGGRDYVGWMRFYDWKAGNWKYAVHVNNTSKGLYEFDEDVRSESLNGQTVSGLALLFHPRAT